MPGVVVSPVVAGTELRCLNLGCGSRYVRGWVNVDFEGFGDVIGHDLRKPLPFKDGEFDVVYHSHVLEHLPRDRARPFLRECRRVLRAGGVLRIAVPDLEGIARAYLAQLEQCRSGCSAACANHEWMTLELYDQVVRTRPGGEMGAFLTSRDLENEPFVISRLGVEARRIIEHSRKGAISNQCGSRTRWGIRSKVRSAAAYVRRAVAAQLAGLSQEALIEATFREKGENHRWMYDEMSLRKLLRDLKFVDVCRRDASTSYITEWAALNLDTEPDGTTYKPDSLFVESRR